MRAPRPAFDDHVLPRVLAPAAELVLDALPPLTPHMRFLEVGAGGGAVARALIERIAGLGRLVTVDVDAVLAADLPAVARRAARAQARADALPFVDHAFDVVVANCVVGTGEHDDDAVLAELRRLLRPGGWLLLTAPLAGSYTGVFDVVDHACAALAFDDDRATVAARRAALLSLDDLADLVAEADIPVHHSGAEERALAVVSGADLLADPLLVDAVIPSLLGRALPAAAHGPVAHTIDAWFPHGMPVVLSTGIVVGRVVRASSP